MRSSKRIRIGLGIALVALLAGCDGPCEKISSIDGPKLSANGVDLSTYVAVGTSLTAGTQSDGLVDHHQVHSFPSIFARQIGMTVQIDGKGTFTMPTVSADGFPKPLLEIKSFSPLFISRAGRSPGAPTNSSQNFAYHDMGVPGAILFDLVDSSFYHSAPPQIRQDFNNMNLVQRSRGLIITQALSLAPTIMSVEYGANEVLGPATQGSAPNANTAAAHAQLMTAAINTIHTVLPGTRVALFNVPDVTSIPFFTTLPAFTLTPGGTPIPLVGANGPCQPGDLLTLFAVDSLAIGTGIPAGGVNYINPSAPSNGRPLPEFLILRAAEVAATQAQIAGMNAVVDSVSQRFFVAKVDLNGLLRGIAADGVTIGPTHYTSDFVTGGLFSLDGIHPNDLAYALMANAMIDAVNARFGCFIPDVNPLEFSSPTASSAKRVVDKYPRSIAGLSESLRALFGDRR